MAQEHLLYSGDNLWYANRFAVTSPRIYSENPEARVLEEQLKQRHPGFQEVRPQLAALSDPDRNFIVAVFVAWAYERAFFEALRSGSLPEEIRIYQDTDEDDSYYTYEFDAVTSREHSLEDRVEFMTRDVRDVKFELSRLKGGAANKSVPALHSM